jgi:hypothetical protein
MAHIYLEITRGIEQGRRYAVKEGAISLGRNPQNAVVFDSREKSVSSHHAILYISPDRMMIQDLSSTNGTFVNDSKVQQQDLSAGDTLGFGRNGPRVKLIVSEEELEETTAPVRSETEQVSATGPENLFDKETGDMTFREDTGLIDQIMNGELAPPSMTMEMEQMLLERRMDARTMQELLKDSGRLGKILDKGNLGATGTHLLRTAYEAGEKNKRQWRIILTSVIAVAVLVVGIIGIRALQYRALVNRGLSLEEQIDSYENMIAEINDNPDANKERLTKLIAALDEANSKLTNVKGSLKEDDHTRFYADTIEMMIDEVMMRFGETEYHVPPEMAERVKHHLDIYSGRMKRTIARYMKRKEMYEPMISRIFGEKRLPLELIYVSMLESGFNPKALSHAGARGLWQFMPATGRGYGLRVTNTVDERCDPEKATRAAAEYFEDLIAIFGGRRSIMLAMAAYNAGERRIMNALRRVPDPMRNRDFWYVYRLGILAEETNEYIPRIISMMILDQNREYFGFAPRTIPQEDLESENDFMEIRRPSEE